MLRSACSCVKPQVVLLWFSPQVEIGPYLVWHLLILHLVITNTPSPRWCNATVGETISTIYYINVPFLLYSLKIRVQGYEREGIEIVQKSFKKEMYNVLFTVKCILYSYTYIKCLKGVWHDIFAPGFLHKLVSPGNLSIPLEHFKVLPKFAGIFATLCLSPVSLTPAISCSPVSTTLR
jgi:hypothetical protein